MPSDVVMPSGAPILAVAVRGKKNLTFAVCYEEATPLNVWSKVLCTVVDAIVKQKRLSPIDEQVFRSSLAASLFNQQRR